MAQRNQEAQVNPSVKFWLESPAGENGFPGNLTVSVTYTLTEENEWQIEYQATTDEQTLLIQPIMSTLI